MTFGHSLYPESAAGAPASVDTIYPTYTNLLNTGSKGSWVEVIDNALVTSDCQWVYVEIVKTGAAGVDTSSVIDIGVDTSGGTSYTAVISNLFAGHTDDHNANNAAGGCLAYSIPLKITSGSAVAIRGQTVAGASRSANVRVMLLGGATGTPYSGSTCTTFGITGIAGTTITPGNDATWSSWVNIGSTTAVDMQAVSLGVEPIAGTAVQRNTYEIQIGVSSAAISPIYEVHMGTSESINGPRPTQPAYKFIASGSQLQARARGTFGSIDTIRVALYAVSAT